MAQEILLTAEAYKKKNDELEYLKTAGRDEIAERIKEARSWKPAASATFLKTANMMRH